MGGTLDPVIEDQADYDQVERAGHALKNPFLEDSNAVVVIQKNTFIDLQPEQSPAGGLHRSSGSCGARLHTLAEECGASEQACESFGEKRLQDTPLASAEPAHIPPTSLRSVGSGAALSAMAAEDLYVTQQSLDAEYSPPVAQGMSEFHFSGLSQVSQTAAGGEPRGQMYLPDMLGGGGIKVKNTFLDFEPSQKHGLGLRSVHTYAGSLADLG
jgi:hypothetical protein